MKQITLIALMSCAIVCSASAQTDRAIKERKPPQSVKKVRAQYILAMSEDDSVCKPILAEYNKQIDLDLFPKSRPYPYPWPVPEALAMKWESMTTLPDGERGNLADYSVLEGAMEAPNNDVTVIRWANWARSDDRFTSLQFFTSNTASGEHRKSSFKTLLAKVIPGGYHLPKLKTATEPTELNDFDVIQLNGKRYVTGKTVTMNGIVEDHKVPKWRVISRIRFSKPPTPPESDLDWTLDSVCYLRVNVPK